MSSHNDIQTGFVILMSIFSVLLLVVIVIGMQTWFYAYDEGEFERKVLSQRPVELTQVRSSQQEKLLGYGWVNSASGVVSIPINQAMIEIAKEY